MFFEVAGWELENGRYSILIQLLGLLLIGIFITYIILSSRRNKE